MISVYTPVVVGKSQLFILLWFLFLCLVDVGTATTRDINRPIHRQSSSHIEIDKKELLNLAGLSPI